MKQYSPTSLKAGWRLAGATTLLACALAENVARAEPNAEVTARTLDPVQIQPVSVFRVKHEERERSEALQRKDVATKLAKICEDIDALVAKLPEFKTNWDSARRILSDKTIKSNAKAERDKVAASLGWQREDQDEGKDAFLACIATEASKADLTDKYVKEHIRSQAPASGAASAAGGMGWQTAALEGLASFISSRAQAELAMWVVTNFRGKMCSDATKSLFEKTCAVTAQDPEALPGSVFISALRSDLESLPYALLKRSMELKLRQRSAARLEKMRPADQEKFLQQQAGRVDDLVLLVRILGGIIDSLRAGNGVVETFVGVADADGLSTVMAKYKGKPCTAGEDIDPTVCRLSRGLYLSAEIARGTIIAYSGTPTKWDPGAIGAYLKSPEFRQRLIDANVFDKPQIDALVKGRLEQWVTWWDSFRNLLMWIESHPGPTGGQTTLDYARILTQRVLPVLRGALLLAEDGARCTAQDESELCWTARRVDMSLDALNKILSAQYADAIRELLVVLDDILAALPNDESLVEVRRYVLFVTDLASAKSPDEVKAALDSAAAPVGGWRIKRRQRFTWSVSALVGVNVMGEIPIPGRAGVKSGVAIGPMAALGFDFAWRVPRKVASKNPSTVGVFVSAIDLGQLVSARLTSEVRKEDQPGPKTASEVSFISVLSPGAFFRVGIANTPFTVGAGLSYAPAMRTYYYQSAPNTLAASPFSLIRVGLFLGIDATLFPFVRKARN